MLKNLTFWVVLPLLKSTSDSGFTSVYHHGLSSPLSFLVKESSLVHCSTPVIIPVVKAEILILAVDKLMTQSKYLLRWSVCSGPSWL